ncbi:MAG: UDP-N-acetylmuramate:L-alanyl-gamma-D-glutamyl-meso-diaminopimelate ligase [Nitrospiria bacterium]
MRIHFIAICGTGMGSLAQMLKASGHKVSGSDSNIYPPMSTLLKDTGIVCQPGFAPQNIDSDIDLVVIGNAVSSSNVEVQEVLRRNIPYLSFPQALARFFLKDRSPIVIAGTHGKTTTSALMAWVLESAGRDPGMLIGGWAKNFLGGSKIGSGPYFVVEGDEYDTAFFDKGPKFLHYMPRWAILTSIEFDHGDIYKSLEQIKSAFQAFVMLLPSTGMLVAAQEDPHVADVIQDLDCPKVRYGLGCGGERPPYMEWSARDIRPRPGGMRFKVVHQDMALAEVDSPMLGRHNVRNALAVIAMAHHLGLSIEEIMHGIATFQGVKRRQEVVGVVDDILIMDDFAHHPTAIRETLAAIRMGFPGRRMWAVFEPRSATSRRKVFQEDFVHAFAEADQVIVAGLYAPEKIQPQERLDPVRLVEDLNRKTQAAQFVPTSDEIVDVLCSHLVPGDIVCLMSSGGFGAIHSKLLAALQKIRSASPD